MKLKKRSLERLDIFQSPFKAAGIWMGRSPNSGLNPASLLPASPETWPVLNSRWDRSLRQKVQAVVILVLAFFPGTHPDSMQWIFAKCFKGLADRWREAEEDTAQWQCRTPLPRELQKAQLIFYDDNDNENHKHISVPSTTLGRLFPTEALIFGAHNNLTSAIPHRF